MQKNYNFPVVLDDDEIEYFEKGWAEIVVRIGKDGNLVYYVRYD